MLRVDFTALAAAAGEAQAAHRRQPALQHLHADPVPPAAVGRPRRRSACDAAEGSRRPDGGGARPQGLRPAERDAAMALRHRAPDRRRARGLRSAAAGRFGGGADDAEAGAARGRPGAARRARHGRLLAAAQAAAPHLGRWLAARGAGVDFDLQRRAEEVPVEEYLRLARRNRPKRGRSLASGGRGAQREGAALPPSGASSRRPTRRSATSPCRRRCSSAACSCRSCCCRCFRRRLDGLVDALVVADAGGHIRRPLP